MTYPTISPKLTLDFANSRQLDPRITFSRSSSATYVHPDTGLITTVPDGAARIEKEGLLMEEARTNLVTTSTPTGSGLSNGWVQRANTTVTTNADVAPDGTTTATSVVPNVGSTDYAYTSFALSPTVTTACVVSTYAKPINNMPSCALKSNSADGNYYIWNFNFETGLPTVINNTGGDTTAFMEPLANGWFRIGFTAPNGTNGIVVNARESWGGGKPPGDGVTGVLFWGCQIEEGDFKTAFIPTTGSTVTRSADVSSIGGTNFSSFYNQSEGTIFTDNRIQGTESSNGRVWKLTSALRLYYRDTGVLETNTATQYLSFPGTVGVDTFTKTAITLKEYDHVGYNSDDGALRTANSQTTAAATLLCVGCTQSGYQLNGHIKRLTYYDRRISNAELETLTS